jgi:UDP-glucose 4-epimerase
MRAAEKLALVTGVAGFIGSHVARRLRAEGWRVVGVDDLSSGQRGNIPGDIDFIEGNLASPAVATSLPREPRAILHLAGQSSGEISFDNPVMDLKKNTLSTLNLIRYGIQNDCERFVYASSMSVYGNTANAPIREEHECSPLSCYGVGKLAAEHYLRVYEDQLPSICLRMFNVYGPGQDLANLRQGMVSIYVAQALVGGKIEVRGSLERYRDFIYIDDVVEAWWRAIISADALGRDINVGTGVRTTVRSLLDEICAQIPGTSYYVRGVTPGDQTGIYADTTRMRACLGLQSFTPLAEGLERFLRWARGALCQGKNIT